jgi:large subunit ribosomal protein L24
MASKKPNIQRSFVYNAPLHLRRKMLSAHLSKDLRVKYKTRALPLRKGDEVEVMRGFFNKKKGKISKVDLVKYKIFIDGVLRKRTDGTERLVPISPSNVRITTLNVDDKRRNEILERKMKK